MHDELIDVWLSKITQSILVLKGNFKDYPIKNKALISLGLTYML